MANPAVAYVQLYPNRSKAAFVQLMGDWTGILVVLGRSIDTVNGMVS
jgi:hypothetical protein